MFYTKDISPVSSPEISPIQSQKKTGAKPGQAFQRETAEIPGSSHISGSGSAHDPGSSRTRLGKRKAEHRPGSSPDESSLKVSSLAEPHQKYRRISTSDEHTKIIASKPTSGIRAMESVYYQSLDKISAGNLIEADKLITPFYNNHLQSKGLPNKKNHSDKFIKLYNNIKDSMRGFAFIRSQHYFEKECEVQWRLLPETPSEHRLTASEFQEAVVFVEAILLNKEVKPDSIEWHKELLTQARKHLEWIKEHKRLPVFVHNIWFECMFELCTQELEINHLQASEEEYHVFRKTNIFINEIKQYDNTMQLAKILDKHVEWVRDNKFSPLSIRSLAYCCHCLRPYASKFKEVQKGFYHYVINYYQACSTIYLGTTSIYLNKLKRIAENFYFLAIPVERFPELMPNLLDAWHSIIRATETDDTNFKRDVERAGVIVSREYIKALADIRNHEYSEASKRVHKIYNDTIDLDHGEKNNLHILGAYICLCASEKEHAYQWLDDCDPNPGTQPYLQKARLYSMLGNSERALELLEQRIKYPHHLLFLAYKHASKEIKDSLADASSTSTDSDTKSVIATKKDPEPEEEETARQLKELEAKCQELQKKNDEWETVEKKMKAENEKLRIELEKSINTCSTYKNSCDENESQIKSLIEKNTTLQKQLNESTTECEAYKSAYGESESYIEDLVEKNQKIQEELNESMIKCKAYKTSCHENEETIKEKKILEKELEEQLSSKEKKYRKLKKELSQIIEQRTKETNQFTLQIESTKQDLDSFKLKNHTLLAENTIIKKTVADLKNNEKKTLESITQHIKQLQNQNQQLNSEKLEQSKKVTAQDVEIKQKSMEIEQLQRQMQWQQQEMERMHNACQQQSEQLQTALTEIALLKQTYQPVIQTPSGYSASLHPYLSPPMAVYTEAGPLLSRYAPISTPYLAPPPWQGQASQLTTPAAEHPPGYTPPTGHEHQYIPVTTTSQS